VYRWLVMYLVSMGGSNKHLMLEIRRENYYPESLKAKIW
jgi:hypothetical protein